MSTCQIFKFHVTLIHAIFSFLQAVLDEGGTHVALSPCLPVLNSLATGVERRFPAHSCQHICHIHSYSIEGACVQLVILFSSLSLTCQLASIYVFLNS